MLLLLLTLQGRPISFFVLNKYANKSFFLRKSFFFGSLICPTFGDFLAPANDRSDLYAYTGVLTAILAVPKLEPAVDNFDQLAEGFNNSRVTVERSSMIIYR